jgi:hypothetical protein
MLDVPGWFLSAGRCLRRNYLGIRRLDFRTILSRAFGDALHDKRAIELPEFAAINHH